MGNKRHKPEEIVKLPADDLSCTYHQKEQTLLHYRDDVIAYVKRMQQGCEGVTVHYEDGRVEVITE